MIEPNMTSFLEQVEAAGKLLTTVKQRGFEAGNIFEGCSSKLPARVDGQGDFVSDVVTTPPANGIEVFQRKAWRINVVVATAAGSVGLMLEKLVTDGFGTANIGLNSRHIGRWRCRGGTQDVLQEPDTANDRRCIHTIGS